MNLIALLSVFDSFAELATIGPYDLQSQPHGACQDQIWNVLPDSTVVANYPSDDGGE